MNDYLKTKSMAAKLGVSAKTLLRWAKAGTVPFVKVSERTWLFSPDAVRVALESRQAAWG